MFVLDYMEWFFKGWALLGMLELAVILTSRRMVDSFLFGWTAASGEDVPGPAGLAWSVFLLVWALPLASVGWAWRKLNGAS